MQKSGNRKLLLFGGSSHPKLAADVAERLGIDLGDLQVKNFANGETYIRYGESLRGMDVFLVQSPYSLINEHLMETLLMINAAKLSSARSVNVIFPSFPYARQDKKSAGREPISARLVADLLQSAGVTRVLSFDLHAGQIQGFFSIPADHMTAMPLLAAKVEELGYSGDDCVIVSPDAGRAKLAKRYSDHLNAGLAVLVKDRPAHNKAQMLTDVIGDVKGKCCVLVDDMIDTAGTLCAGAEALKAAGASKIIAAATHGILSGPALERIEQSSIEKVLITDTLPLPKTIDKIVQVSIAGVLAQSIHNVFQEESVSAIFGGDNQAF